MGEKRKILTCKRCDANLSKPVVIFRDGDADFPPPVPAEYEHIVDEGFAYETSARWVEAITGVDLPTVDFEFTPNILMTTRDLLESVQYTEDLSRLGGCCGLDGLGGPNRVCRCGAEVGTEKSDCWTSYMFIPNPEETRWKETE